MNSVGRLVERARTASWNHEEYLIACLQREVSAREAHGRQDRFRALQRAQRDRADTPRFELHIDPAQHNKSGSANSLTSPYLMPYRRGRSQIGHRVTIRYGPQRQSQAPHVGPRA